MRTTSIVLSGVLTGCLGLGLVATGCGGGQKKTDPGAGATGDVSSGGGRDYQGDPCEDPCSGGMCPPETLDAIQRSLDSKRRAAARCLADAVNSGKISKNAHGHVALSFVIGKNGKARGIAVAQSSIKNEVVEQCVISKVAEIDFGAVPIDLDWSYTYAFESM